MASPESQGKTIAVVTLVVLLVAALSAAYYFFTQVKDAEAAAATARSAKQEIDRKLAEKTEQYQSLASLVKGAQVANVEHAAFMDDAKKLMVNPNADDPRAVPGAPQRRAVYSTLAEFVEYSNAVVKSQQEELKKLDESKAKLAQEVRTSGGIGDAKVAQQKDQLTKAITEFQDESKKNRQTLEEQRLIATTAQTQREAAIASEQEQRRSTGKMRDAYEGNMRQLRNFLLALREKDDQRNVTKFQHADGEVTQVVEGGSYVFLDVGRDDGATEGLTFGLYGQKDAGFIDSLPKCRVEIVQLMDAHRCKAIVHEYDIKNPVVPGDKVFNPVWNRGMKMKIAIVGFIDMDRDGRYDNADFERIVRKSGAEIVARVDLKDGRLVGAVDAETAFLVEGETEPEAKQFGNDGDVLVRRKMAEAATVFRKQATDFSVPRVPFDKFLEFMGYRNVRLLQQPGSEEDRVRQENLNRSRRFRPLATTGGADVDVDKVDTVLGRNPLDGAGKNAAGKDGKKSPGDAPAASTEAGKMPGKKEDGKKKKGSAKDDEEL